MNEPTPSQRFAAAELRQQSERSPFLRFHKRARALRLASFWDGFPHSYTPQQVTAGRELICSPHDWELVHEVLSLELEGE